MNPIIKCEHTDFGYENHDAVIDLNLEIYPGDYLCVVGENGSGKSTLIKGMLGLLKPTGGSLSVADELKRGGIGYLPQQQYPQVTSLLLFRNPHKTFSMYPSCTWYSLELWMHCRCSAHGHPDHGRTRHGRKNRTHLGRTCEQGL